MSIIFHDGDIIVTCLGDKISFDVGLLDVGKVITMISCVGQEKDYVITYSDYDTKIIISNNQETKQTIFTKINGSSEIKVSVPQEVGLNFFRGYARNHTSILSVTHSYVNTHLLITIHLSTGIEHSFIIPNIELINFKTFVKKIMSK